MSSATQTKSPVDIWIETRRKTYERWLWKDRMGEQDGEFHIHSSEGLTRARNNEEERSRAQSERNGE